MKRILRKKCKGFTLAEAMMATVVLGIAAAGLIMPYAAGAMARSEGINRTLGSKLASDLMEQIISTNYGQIVSTHDGYTETQGNIKDATGSIFNDSRYDNFSRTAECSYVYVDQQAGSETPIYILGTVKVYYKGQEFVSLSRLIGEYDDSSNFESILR